MDGLYALKPWYAARLTLLRRALVARRVAPATLTWAGVACGAAAGAVIAVAPYGLPAATAVAALLTARLTCANLDGGVARERGVTSPWGVVQNELGDRLAELAALAGLLAVAPYGWVAVTAAATVLPSWVSLAGAAAGAPRLNGGPVGKTERTLLLVLAAGSGAYVPVLGVLALGSMLTAGLRLARLRALLRGAR
jgi:CDP-diacylglycerol--glycerol-3-phosphate 3-phosphatidyltransferase